MLAVDEKYGRVFVDKGTLPGAGVVERLCDALIWMSGLVDLSPDQPGHDYWVAIRDGVLTEALDKNTRDAEPVFLIRAKDKVSVEAVLRYRDAYEDAALNPGPHGVDEDDFVTELRNVAGVFEDWQESHPALVRIPD